MLCDDVIRKLTESDGWRDEAALAEHLAGCSACAEWLDRAQRLEKLWDTTRPAEPLPQTWDVVWSSVNAHLDQPNAVERNGSGLHLADFPRALPERRESSEPAFAPSRTRRWRGLAAAGMIGLAQAAALLLAVGVSWHVPVKAPEAWPGLPEAKADVEVGEGQVVVIRSEGPKVDVVDLTALETPHLVPSIFTLLPGMYAAVDFRLPERSSGMDRWYLVHAEFESFSNSEIELEEGQVVVIRSEGSKVDVIDLVAQEAPKPGLASADLSNWRELIDLTARETICSLDRWDLVLNVFESMTSSSLAMAE
jgi:hypothetical protein